MLKHTHGFHERESENKNHIKICEIGKRIYQKAESLEQFGGLLAAEFADNKKVKITFEDGAVICEFAYPKKEPRIFTVFPCTYITPEKTVSRVHESYTLGTKDHRDQYRMLLPDGKTCADCRYVEKCVSMWGGNESNTRCGFGDNKFHQK